jgi:hypothetical protein
MYNTKFLAAFAVVSLLLCTVSMAAGPIVIQAAGPNRQSIQSAINAYRKQLGGVDNDSITAEFESGRREINWDGGGANFTTTAPVTPFTTFLNNRGGLFTTPAIGPGTGLTQAPPSGGPQGGLATLLNNPTYGTTFRAFSSPRVFAAVGSNVMDALFFVAGSSGNTAAAVTGFGVVFTDVDQPRRGPSSTGNSKRSTLIEYFGVDGKLLFSSFAPPSPGDGNFSFFGIVFKEPVIAHVRITMGNVALGPDDNVENDVVVMDDFIYGEPHEIE